MNLNVGCGPHRADGWVNTDLSHVPGTIEPDVIVGWDHPLPFRDAAFDRVYLGHVLEHVPWDAVGAFLADVWRVLTPGGTVMVVGPDVHRTVNGIADRSLLVREVWPVLVGAWEDDVSHQADDAPDRPGARHQWNAYPERIIRAFSGPWVDVCEVPVTSVADDGWPLVSDVWWQCAVSAAKPEAHDLT